MVPIVTAGSGARRARARRALVSQLQRAQAYSHDREITLVPGDRVQEGVLARLVSRGIVRPGPKGGYWLDREAYGEFCRQQAIFVVGILLVSLALGVTMALNAPHTRHRSPKAMYETVP